METITTITGQTTILSPVELCRFNYLKNQIANLLTIDRRGRMGVEIYERDKTGNILYCVWSQLVYDRPQYFRYSEFNKQKSEGLEVYPEEFTVPPTIVKIGNLNVVVGEYFGLHAFFEFVTSALRSKTKQTKMRTLIDLHLFLNFYVDQLFTVRQSYAKEFDKDGNPLIYWAENANYDFIKDDFLDKETSILSDNPFFESDKWKVFKEPTKEEILKGAKVFIQYGSYNTKIEKKHKEKDYENK